MKSIDIEEMGKLMQAAIDRAMEERRRVVIRRGRKKLRQLFRWKILSCLKRSKTKSISPRPTKQYWNREVFLLRI